MNGYLNYLIEANIGLVAFLLFYILLLSNETNFNFKRGFLLAGIGASLLFPVAKFTTASNAIPSISNVLPSYFLPELVINANEVSSESVTSGVSYWAIALWIYLAIASLMLVVLLIRLSRILYYLQKSHTTLHADKFRIIESDSDLSTFSFFHYIFIGNTSAFSSEEKQQIIKHEIAHSTKFHSFDILLTELLKIIFWFNPAVYYFKSIFNSIHEFQADQLAADTEDVNQYCNLLARVALQSADYPIANYFNNSLTLKRIAMIKTAKTKLSRWKIAAIAPLFIGLFVVVACQDQTSEKINNLISYSFDSVELPEEVKTQFNLTKERSPKSEFVIFEWNEEGRKAAEELDKKLAQEKKSVHTLVIGMNTFNNKNVTRRSFVLYEYTDQATRLAELSSSNEIFTVTDLPAIPMFGMEQFYENISQLLKYPTSGVKSRVQGKVLIEFVVDKNGDLKDYKIVKGLNEECDAEAIRALMLSQKWYPAKHQGKIVNQKMVLPITFSLGNETSKSSKI